MVKGSMQQEELTILSIYAPNTGAPRFQTFLETYRDSDSHITNHNKHLSDHSAINETEN